jgi:pilus assembly protein CpaB
MMPVVVAMKDIRGGSIIERSAVAVVPWPAETRPREAYATVDSVVARMARFSIRKGNWIFPEQLHADPRGSGPDGAITPGMRAYSIRIENPAESADSIHANSRVDVIIVSDDHQAVGRAFMSNPRVLSVGAVLAHNRNGKGFFVSVATLETTPAEAERLAIAAKSSRFVLR